MPGKRTPGNVRIPYRVHPADKAETLRPYLRVQLPIKGQWVSTIAIIDSGADYSMLPLPVARDMGLHYDPSDPKDMTGIAGMMKGAFIAQDDLTVRSEAGEFSLRKPWLAELLPIILLGRSDFFAQFKVEFGKHFVILTRH